MRKLHYEVSADMPTLGGVPYYALADHALDYRRTLRDEQVRTELAATTSVVIGTIQIEVEISSQIALYVWGYSPLQSWIRTSLNVPDSCVGTLRILCDGGYVAGVSVPANGNLCCSPSFDSSNGWVCVGDLDLAREARIVEFATDTRAVVVDGQLKSLWIRPTNWQSIGER